MKLRCIIVDDEPAGRKVIQELVEEVSFLELAGVAENPLRAVPLLNENNVDLMFLDIQMPKMNGIDFVRSLHKPPMVVLTTAYQQYALDGFELDVMDYLLKPVSLERFLKAATKCKDYAALMQTSGTNKETVQDYLFIKSDSVYEKILFDDILFIEALNNFVSIYTRHRKFVTWLTMKSLLDNLPKDAFLCIHRSYIVSIAKVDKIAGNELYVNSRALPISKSMKKEVLEQLMNNRLLNRQ